MDWGSLMEMASRWGLGIVLSIAMFWMFYKFLSKMIANANTSMLEERKTYKDLIDKQSNTIDNHISHLTESLGSAVEKIGDLNGNLQAQKECLDHGFTRVVDAIRGQTETLSNKIDGKR